MTRHLATIAIFLGLAVSGASAQAQQDVESGATVADQVVVELFTSQGCAACPPADAMIGDLAAQDDVLALSLHVDYWNYLGWTDTFSDHAYTERQYGYGHRAGSGMVYTPQLIVGGQDHVMGARAMEIMDLLAAHRAAPRRIGFDLREVAGGLRVTAVWLGEASAPEMVVQLVQFSPREVVDIMRGENAGRVAEYHNVVRDLTVLSDWSGAQPFDAEIALDPDLRGAIIVQVANHGPILGAARLD